jgi:hypothetical protein
MRIYLRTASLLMLMILFSTASVADEKQDARQLEQLIATVKSLLPPGWEVAFEVKNDHCGRARPKLVIRSTEKLPVEHMGPGMGPSPNINQENVTIEVTFVPYITTEDYAAARKRNDDLERHRRQYEENRLKQRQSAYKGGFTPASYERQTRDKSPVVREYAFLWLSTEPQELPTHHYGTLAVATYDLPYMSSHMIKIHNTPKDKEYQQIVGGLEKIFVPYEKAPSN